MEHKNRNIKNDVSLQFFWEYLGEHWAQCAVVLQCLTTWHYYGHKGWTLSRRFVASLFKALIYEWMRRLWKSANHCALYSLRRTQIFWLIFSLQFLQQRFKINSIHYTLCDVYPLKIDTNKLSYYIYEVKKWDVKRHIIFFSFYRNGENTKHYFLVLYMVGIYVNKYILKPSKRPLKFDKNSHKNKIKMIHWLINFNSFFFICIWRKTKHFLHV